MSTSRLAAFVISCCAATVILNSQAPAPQPAGQAAPAAPPPGGRGSIEAQIAQGADFLKRPPVLRQTPEAELQNFLLPPGFRPAPGVSLSFPSVDSETILSVLGAGVKSKTGQDISGAVLAFEGKETVASLNGVTFRAEG